MPRLLVAEASPTLRTDFAEHLLRAGHDVQAAGDYPGLKVAMARFNPGILVLDQSLPNTDTLKLLAELRQQQPTLGLVLLSDRPEPADRLSAWRHGADQVLLRPVLIDELVLVVRNLARRIEPSPERGWTLDLASLTLTAPEGTGAPLTPSEAAVLQAIARAVHHRCERPQLAEALGEDWRSFDERRLEALMSRLRRKLTQAVGREVPLRTMRGQGYGFVEPLVLR